MTDISELECDCELPVILKLSEDKAYIVAICRKPRSLCNYKKYIIPFRKESNDVQNQNCLCGYRLQHKRGGGYGCQSFNADDKVYCQYLVYPTIHDSYKTAQDYFNQWVSIVNSLTAELACSIKSGHRLADYTLQVLNQIQSGYSLAYYTSGFYSFDYYSKQTSDNFRNVFKIVNRIKANRKYATGPEGSLIHFIVAEKDSLLGVGHLTAKYYKIVQTFSEQVRGHFGYSHQIQERTQLFTYYSRIIELVKIHFEQHLALLENFTSTYNQSEAVQPLSEVVSQFDKLIGSFKEIIKTHGENLNLYEQAQLQEPEARFKAIRTIIGLD